MSFKEWLPITGRNRVALGFAALSLVMFVVWNCLPHYEYGETEPDGIVASFTWLEILWPDHYIRVFKSPDIDGFLDIAASMALIQCGLVTFVALPFWKLLHASAFVRLPLAFVNLAGGAIVVWFVIQYDPDDAVPYVFAILSLIALNMFALSASLFVFKNELALREERGRPREG
ncbi:MAG: hypothetical protein RLZZ505_681 [Verrucomicrobiota bacterium]|jgi:hypothetical protein